MKKRKLFFYIMISATICFGVIPLVINWMFKHSAPLVILQAEWGAGEAMGYVSGMLSFIGTMFLGGVSWKQNSDLQKRQDETFIAENSCGVLLEKVDFKVEPKSACRPELHPETIVCSKSLSENEHNAVGYNENNSFRTEKVTPLTTLHTPHSPNPLRRK